MPADLDVNEVSARLASYENKNTQVTDELYGFGSMLVSEFVDRVHHLDAKAATLAGYASGIVALLVSTSSFWKTALDSWATFLVFGAALCAIFAAAFSLKAASIFRFVWFSDDEWLHEKYLDDAESLRRYHILTMHNVIGSHRDKARDKSSFIRLAQWALGVAAILLFVALGDAAWKAPTVPEVTRSFLLHLGSVGLAALA